MSDNQVDLKPQEYKTIKQRLARSEKYVNCAFKEKHEACWKLYLGEHYDDLDWKKPEARVIINRIYQVVQTKVSSIAFNYPEFMLYPLNSEADLHRVVALPALNYEWRMSGAQKQAKRALLDKEVCSIGIVQTGWLYKTKDQTLLDGRIPVEGEPPDTTPDFYSDEQLPEPPLEDRFYTKRINPLQFLPDPEGGPDIDDHAFCGFWEWKPLKDLKRDKRYKNTKELKGTKENTKAYFTETLIGTRDEDLPGDVLRVKLFHYYELKDDHVLHVVVCEEHDKPLLSEKLNWQAKRYPFRVLRAPGSNDEFYGLPTPLLILHPQREVNEIRSQMSMHRRGSTPAYQVQGSLEPKAKQQLMSAAPLRIVETPLGQGAIQPIQPMQLNNSIFQSEEAANRDIEQIAGLSSYQNANPVTKRVTTSEAQLIGGSSDARTEAARQDFEIFLSGMGEDCLDWNMQNSVHTRSLPIYDEKTDTTVFKDYTGDQIRGKYLVEVFVGSTEAPNSQNQIEQIGFMLQSLTPYIQTGQVNVTPLLKQMFKQLPGIRNVDEIFIEQPQAPPGMPPPPGEEPPPDDGMAGQPAPLPPGPIDPAAGAGGMPPEMQAALAQALMGQQ